MQYESEHYVFHFAKGSAAGRDIRKISSIQEACFSKITGFLHTAFPRKIHYWLCSSPEEVGRLYGDNEPCNGFAREPDSVYAVYTDEVQCIGAHEDAHLISYTIGRPESVFLREGLAMFFDETWWGRPNTEWVRQFLEEKRMPEILELFSDECFDDYDCSVTYPVAGAFTEYLLNTFGPEAYLNLYRYTGTDWEAAFRMHLGKGIDETAEAFQERAACAGL